MTVQDQIRITALSYGVDPALALAVAKQESNFNQAARGSSGEVGVFQLMQATARDLGVDPYNESQNIEGGVRYLSQQLSRFGSPDLALAAYNCGPTCAASGDIPSSTRSYVSSVLSTVPLFDIASPSLWPSLNLVDGRAPSGGSLDEGLGGRETALLIAAAALAVILLSS